jgi:hypothetical protein
VSRLRPAPTADPATDAPAPVVAAVVPSTRSSICPCCPSPPASGSTCVRCRWPIHFRDVADGAGLEIGHEDFETGRTLVDPRCACPRSSISRLGPAEPEASCSSHRAADEASTFTTCASGKARCACRLANWFAGSIPVPASTENLCDRLAPAGVFAVGAARKRQCRKRTLYRARHR